MHTESVFDIKPSGLTDMKRESPDITLFTFTALKKICLFRPKVQIRDMCRREVIRAFIHAESMHGKACVRVLLRNSCKKKYVSYFGRCCFSPHILGYTDTSQ